MAKSAQLLLPSRTFTAAFEHIKHAKRYFLIGLVGSLGLVIVILGMLSAFLDERSFVQIQIPGIAPSRNLADQSLAAQIDQAVKQYQLKVRDENGTETAYPLSSVGITVDNQLTIAQAQASQMSGGYLGRLQWWRKVSVPLYLKTDDQTLDSFAQSLSKQLEPVKNAELSIDKDVVQLKPGTNGKAYGLINPKQTILSAVASLQTTPLELKLQITEPALTTTRLKPLQQKLETVITQNVSFGINGKTVTAKPADIGTWIELSPVEADKTVDITVNSGKVLEYINAIAKPFVQPPRSQVVMTQADGSQAILAQGQNGVDVENKEDIAKDVASKLLDAKGIHTDMPIKFASFKTISAAAYDKLIVVDTTSKRLYAYEQSNLMRTFLISAGAPGTPTPLGQYKIYTKVRQQDMRGLNTDGSRYFQPDVEWINYFYQDYAIHGNYWRPTSYFGNVNSSHGCVGIVNADAEWLYNWAPVGTTVIVHN